MVIPCLVQHVRLVDVRKMLVVATMAHVSAPAGVAAAWWAVALATQGVAETAC